MEVKLLSYTENPEQAIIQAAANCWQSTPRAGILDHIVKAGHWTPLEFAQFNFEIGGVSRALTHQLVRKRVGVAFAQESQRYVCQRDFNIVVPDSIKNSRTCEMAWVEGIEAAARAYEALIDDGIPPEDARYVLPSATTSTIHMAINYHALVDLAKERMCSRAQWEIRELMYLLRAEVEKVSPKLAGWLQPKCYWLKHCPEGKPCENYAGKKGEADE